MSKIFIDGGSGLNIIYANTLRAISFPLNSIQPMESSFYGIVPGKPNIPMGQVTLEVIFGKPENFRSEMVTFEVVDWPSQYHAILGRPALAKFMAVPHYAYLKLKILGPQGTFTVSGSFQRSNDCDL